MIQCPYMGIKVVIGFVAVAVIVGAVWFYSSRSTSVPSPTTGVECAKERIAELENMPIVATPEQYPVSEMYTGKVAKLDLSSSFIATRFKGVIESAMTGGVNFAGHYIIATWGMTGVGSFVVVVDAENGQAYPFPYVSQTGFSFNKDSSLLVVDPTEKLKEAAPNCLYMEANARPYYFVWESNKFTLIGPTDNPLPNSKDNGWMHQ